jgi:hypothetical protein
VEEINRNFYELLGISKVRITHWIVLLLF